MVAIVVFPSKFENVTNIQSLGYRHLLNCNNKQYPPRTYQRGSYWVLENYVRASHGNIKCYESITYTTHGDFTFLDNVIPLVARWRAPIGMSLYAPGTDFKTTLDSIRYLRECSGDDADLVKQYVTFHIYFHADHIPVSIPSSYSVLNEFYQCPETPPYKSVLRKDMFKNQKNLTYPINVGRNIARDAAITHFIFPCDIELYPSLHVVLKFLEMIARNDSPLLNKKPRVLPAFEIKGNTMVPDNKTELIKMLQGQNASLFHEHSCRQCHAIPSMSQWEEAPEGVGMPYRLYFKMVAESSVNPVTQSEMLNISFHNLSYTAGGGGKEKKEILKHLSGCFRSGRLCAILGPSGAGKTSLLNILSGFRKPTEDSSLLVNGKNVADGFIRRKSSYIPQDQSHLGKLTTNETLGYAAELKLPSFVTKDEKQRTIAKVIQSLGLEKCEDTWVGELSGGERKRVSIGEELISNPPIMIFDEPTSGLDSVSTVQVCTHLRSIAHAGRTVICVIHQPSSHVLQLFDDLFILSGGHCLYNGPVDDIVPNFEEAGFFCPQYYNRADFVLEVASHMRDGNLDLLITKAMELGYSVQTTNQNSNNQPSPVYESTGNLSTVSYTTTSLAASIQGGISSLQNLYVQGNNNSNEVILNDFSFPISQWKQFRVLLSRTVLCNRREFIVTHLKIISHLILGFLIGLAFYDFGNDGNKVHSNAAMIFILMTVVFFSNALPLILLYPSEAKIFHREYMNNWYGFFPYFYAKILAEIPTMLLCTILTLIPSYIISGQPLEGFRITLTTIMFILTSITSFFYGFAVGAIFDVTMGIFMLPVTGMPMLIFSGFFIPYNQMPWIMRPISYFPYFRYLYEGMILAIYGYNREDLNCSTETCLFKSIDMVIELLDVKQNNLMLDMGCTILWIVVLKILSFVALKIKLKKVAI
ncbi:ATP-binding cassette sub-family G member 1 [Sergentomyia squamirostris]